MNFNIRKAKNGYVLKVTDFIDDETEEIVFQEKYDDDNEIECFADFLWVFAEHYGPTTSRYSPKRIYIRIEPGDKYEKEDETD